MKSAYLKKVNKKKVLGYVLLPGIIPRARELFEGSFGYIAFLMAQIYAMVRLLPDGHAYLNPQNIGNFSVRNVIAEAANHLVIKKENIDQIIIFFALLGGTILLLLQIFILIYSLLIEPALAQTATTPTGFALFATPDALEGDASKDVAFMLLDHVFGVPEFFCTIGNQCTEVLAGGPNPFQKGMQSLFQFYSTGILLIAVLIFLYFMVVVVVETAVSGTPFGQRFQNVWVPVRLVVALGLLIPLGYGYNTGQYIAFYAAKSGSGLATNGWNLYNNGIAQGGIENPTGEQETLVSLPSPQSIAPLVQGMTIVHSCAYAYYLTNRKFGGKPAPPDEGALIQPYFVKSPSLLNTGNTETSKLAFEGDFDDAVEFYNGGNIIIRFGIKDDDKFTKHSGNVEPTCGEIKIPVHNAGLAEGEDTNFDDPLSAFSAMAFTLTNAMWDDDDFHDFAARMMEIQIKRGDNAGAFPCIFGQGKKFFPQEEDACYTKSVEGGWRADRIKFYQSSMNTQLELSWAEYSKSAPFKLTDDIKDRGWGGAGIWYNKLSQMNGQFIAAVMDTASMSEYPLVMKQVRKSNLASNKKMNPLDEYNPRAAKSSAGEPNLPKLDGGTQALNIAAALYKVHHYWNVDGGGDSDVDQDNKASPNFIVNMANLLLGTTGLFNMRKNARTHPLSKLIGIGKGLVEASVRNMAVASTSAFLGGVAGAFQNKSGAALLKALADIFKSTAFLGLTGGFVLFYIIPFLPFIYTFFAVGGWIKTIFEAMVGIPLWALAHLRLDGEGLPGQSAENGYFLILEIFLRPILTVFGLIAALTIFTAQVRILDSIFDLATSNLGGFDDSDQNQNAILDIIDFRRSSVDQLFFTIIYAIIVYMMATGSFKLIDEIPKNILRWAGPGISAFGDINEDPKDLQRYAATAGIAQGRQIVDSIDGASSGLGGALGKSMAKPPGGQQ